MGRGRRALCLHLFCFSVASTFAKTGLLTFRGEARAVCGPEPAGGGGIQAATRAGGWAQPGRQEDGSSEHRACLWVGLCPGPKACGRRPPTVGNRGCWGDGTTATRNRPVSSSGPRTTHTASSHLTPTLLGGHCPHVTGQTTSIKGLFCALSFRSSHVIPTGA